MKTLKKYNIKNHGLIKIGDKILIHVDDNHGKLPLQTATLKEIRKCYVHKKVIFKILYKIKNYTILKDVDERLFLENFRGLTI